MLSKRWGLKKKISTFRYFCILKLCKSQKKTILMCNNTVYFVKNFDYRYLSSWAINYTNTFLQHMKHRIATLLHIILQWQCTLFFVNLNFFCSLICLVLYCTKRCRRALVTGIFHLWFRFQCTICLALKSLSEYNCMNIVISCLNKTTSNLLKMTLIYQIQ